VTNIPLIQLPVRCSELSDSLPVGLRISSRILDPILVIQLGKKGFEAVLGGVLSRRGIESIFEAPTSSHNWIVDGDVVRPLPNDIGSILSGLFGKYDLQNLSFSDVLAIARIEQDLIRIHVTPEVLTPASEAAAGSGDVGEIPGLRATLFPYQTHGVSWMQKTISHTGGLILADEMGLGKTIQIISLLLLSPPSKESPALIICPTSLIANWKREISQFAPDLSILIHRGAARTGIYSGLLVAQVVITTYDTAVNDISLLEAIEWSWLICDEAQAIKNPDSNRRRALSQIPRRRSVPMTGTPVENSLMDLWSLTDFAIPGLLGTRSEFESMYPDNGESAKALSSITDPIVLKRKVADVAGDLPARIDIDIPIELGEDLIVEYERIRTETLAKYPSAGSLVATGQLQVFCAHPWLQAHKSASEFWYEEAGISRRENLPLFTPKVELAVSLIKEAFASGRKVLVFALFNRCGDLIREAVGEARDVYWGSINGSTPQEARQEIVDEFTEHDGNACLILNPRAAGSGLNITAATVVIHFTQVWNPALEAQASARAHRRGQTLPVTIYRLYYEDTVESVMIERSEWKRDMANEAVPISTRDDADLKRALQISPRRGNE